MISIIDTSSLLALIKYYLPFDTSNSLKYLINQKFDDNEFLILDRVFEEATYIANGIIIKELDFLAEKSKHIKTADILPNSKFFNLLENQFCNKEIKKLKNISDTEFELEKTKYLNSADGKIILYAIHIKQQSPLVVTEETKYANDNKLFKKIPDNCFHINIDCCPLPLLLKDHFNLNLADYLK